MAYSQPLLRVLLLWENEYPVLELPKKPVLPKAYIEHEKMWEKKAEQAWLACPCRCHPIPLADINVNRHALLKGIERINDEQVLKLVHVRTLSSTTREKGGSWMWLMRCKRQWVFSQCNYTLESAIDLRQFWWCVSILQTFYHNSAFHAFCCWRGIWQGIENQISLDIVLPTAWECHVKQWTLDMTLKAINKHDMLWRQGKLSKLSGFGTGPLGETFLFSFLFWGDRNLEQDSCSY